MLNVHQVVSLKSRLHACTGSNRPLDEMAPLPAVDLIVAGLPDQLIASDLGQDDRPDQPVNAAASDDAPADDAVEVVRQRLVHRDTVRRGYERRDDEVDVAGEEEDGDGQGGAEGRVPVVMLAVRVEPDEAEGDEGVDDGERIGDDVEDEVVGVAGRRSQHDDDGHEPVLEETGERSVEGPVAGEEAGEG